MRCTVTDDVEVDLLRERSTAKAELALALVRGEETWDPETLGRDFAVQGFMAPFVMVKRRSDGAVGTLKFVHAPRIYFNWVEDQ